MELATNFRWTDETPLSHWSAPAGAAVAYLVVVFAIKAATSSEIRSETFELCHNALLVALSFSMMCGALYGAKLRYDDEGLVDGLLCTHRDPEHIWDGPLGAVTYVFYASKFYEFIDTFVLALRQKKTIPLHLWHHASMPMVCWSWFAYPWLEGAWWCCFVNSAIHTMMYSYYFATSLGIKVWYKKYITSAQIVQFMTGTIVSTIFVVLKASGRGCTSHYGPAIFSNMVNLTFLYMFYQFYKKSYSESKKVKKGN